ncbi:MAG: hypothetical protein SFU27_08525, partial [Thermonemataceae bacterium]|nr:hypothetical protein [Thermonemataceae bacterium]
GKWEYYYLNERLESVGKYKIDSYISCGVEASRVFYEIKFGEWIYFYENGQKKAEGIYDEKIEQIRTNCGGDKKVLYKTNDSWKFWDKNGNTISKEEWIKFNSLEEIESK